MDFDTINNAINEAEKKQKKKGIKGKESTPFLLAKVKEITEGQSLEANIQLVLQQCKIRSKISC